MFDMECCERRGVLVQGAILATMSSTPLDGITRCLVHWPRRQSGICEPLLEALLRNCSP
jgi:hypothetical protein